MKGVSPQHWISPDWQPHERVMARVTTRIGGYSPSPWQGFNLGDNCEDEAQRVAEARGFVHEVLATPFAPAWLRQVHGTDVIQAGAADNQADGVMTHEVGRPCAVLTADCLPVLLARTDGSAVGALHAGWRGLLNGIIEQGVAQMRTPDVPLSAWLGPAICSACYQVEDRVRDVFVARSAAAGQGFYADGPGHWRMNLVFLARQRLVAAGVTDIHGGHFCTHCRNDLFYSFRHEGQTGRFATLIWLKE